MGSKFKGYFLGISAAAFYGMNPLFALPLYGDGMSTASVLLLRYSIAVPVLALILKYRGRSFRVSRHQFMILLLLGLLMGFSSLALFESYNHMDAGIASSLLFVYPLMVALIMSVVYHERLSMSTLICLSIALAGIYLLYHSSSGATLSTTGTLWVMASSLSYAIYIVGVNNKALKKLPTIVLTFYCLLSGWTIFVLQVAAGGGLQLPTDAKMWSCAVMLGIFPTAVSLLLTSKSIHLIGATPTAILGVFEPVTAVMFGIFVFGEKLTARDVTGLILIMIAVCYVVGGDGVSSKLTRVKKLFPKLHRKS